MNPSAEKNSRELEVLRQRLAELDKAEFERQQAAEALRSNEEEFRILLDESSDPIFAFYPDGAYHYVNRAFANGVGKAPEVIIGRKIWDVFPKEEADKRFDVVKWVFENGESKVIEVRVPRQDGDRYYITTAKPILDDQRRVISVICISKDITERKQAEDALRESEQHYRTLANSGSTLMWTSGPDKLCNYFNEPWMQFTGRSLDQELGNGWAEGVHPEDFDRCLQTYVTAFDQRIPFSMEYRLRHADGSYRRIRDDGNPRYDTKGGFLGYIGFCIDVTESRRIEVAITESERKYRSLFESANDGIFLQDASGFLDCNRRGAEMYGLPKEKIVGRSPADFCPERQSDGRLSSEAVAEKIAAAFRGESPEFEWQALRADGTHMEVEIRLNRIEISGTSCLQAIVRDITERKRQENIIKESHALLTRQKAELEETLGRIKRLEGLLSICMQCKKIRTENNDWHQLEQYIGEHSDAVFSHGLCPECLEKAMKKLD